MTMTDTISSPNHDMDREEIRLLRSTAERLRELAKLTFDRRTASSIAVCAAELEREVRRREIRRHPGMAAPELRTAQ